MIQMALIVGPIGAVAEMLVLVTFETATARRRALRNNRQIHLPSASLPAHFRFCVTNHNGMPCT